MPKRLTLDLTAQQRAELIKHRDHEKLAYLRERCAALLKIADGWIASEVARSGLHRRHDPDVIYDWYQRYQAEGLQGLKIRAGRGRKPAFSPAGLDEELAEADLAHHVHRSPELFEIDRSTWTLSTIRSVTTWMSQVSLTTVHKYLHRFRLSYKRGRQHVHSPDPQYNQKMQAIALARDLALQAPGDVVFLYQDEHTANLRPVVGRSYGCVGDKGPKASGAASSLIRLAGVLDVATGQVLVRRRTTFPVKELFRFFYHVEQHYPQAQVIYIALDNWPNHFHRYVLDNLKRINSKIRLLPLPTYAPWTNPIEKFWLKLNREFMRHHRYGREKLAFRDALDLWLDKHREESAALLHEVGLLPKGWKVLPD